MSTAETRHRWLQALRTGEGVKAGWAGVMEVTNGLAAAGFPDEFIRESLLSPDNAGVAYLNRSSAGFERPRSSRERMVRDALRKVRQRQATARPMRDRGEVLETIAALRLAVDDAPERWRGRAGASDRAVLLGAYAVASSVGRLEFGASVRQLADASGVGVRTAHAARERLAAERFITIVREGTGRSAAILRVERRHLEPSGSVLSGTVEGSVDLPRGSMRNARKFESDVWRWGVALGKKREHIYALLSDEPASTAQLAELLGVGARTVRGHLQRLRELDLAEYFDGAWVRGPADPVAIAFVLGAAGTGDRQRERHRTHAAQRRAWLDRRGPTSSEPEQVGERRAG